MPRQDLWDGCYDGEHKERLSPEAFQQTFCRVCRNEGCQRSIGGQSLWARRMATQVERLLTNPNIADPNDPRFAELRQLPFLDKFQEALSLEISSQRGDWEIPTQADVARIVAGALKDPSGFQKQHEYTVLWEGTASGSKGETYSVTLLGEGDKPPTWACTCPGFHHRKKCKHIEEARVLYEQSVEEPPPEPPPPPVPEEVRVVSPEAWKQMRERNLVPKAPNTSFPAEGMMVDGSPIPSTREEDPWAVPDPVVPVHGKIVLGSTGPKKE